MPYERGDYVKVEFPDEATGIAEWMLKRVQRAASHRSAARRGWYSADRDGLPSRRHAPCRKPQCDF